MPSLDFLIDDGEFAYEGVANYSVRKGCKGDHETPGVPDAVDTIAPKLVTSLGLVCDEQVIMNERNVSREMSRYWVAKIRNSRLLMERLEELCEEDLLKGDN